LKAAILVPPLNCEYQIGHLLLPEVVLRNKIFKHDDVPRRGRLPRQIILKAADEWPLVLVLTQVSF
jgi:hypothetical protein